MATPVVEESSESLRHKTWLLKVPIPCACEGCKKKVRKILFKVEGVYSIEIDAKQQKVTVIGNVQADALINKLVKHGKQAKLLPQNSDPNEKKPAKVNNRNKHSKPENSKAAAAAATDAAAHGGGTGGDKEVKPPVKVEGVQESAKKGVEGSGGGAGKTAGELTGGGDAGKAAGELTGGGGAGKATGELTGGRVAVKETKSEGKKPDTGSAGNQVGKSGADLESVESGIDVEKKKSKGQKGKIVEGEPSSGSASARTGSSTHDDAGPPPITAPVNHSPPRHQGYQYHQLPHYSAPPPAYAVSYNTAHPSSSYTASYASPAQLHSYAYSSNPNPVAQAPPLDYDMYPRQPLDSFEILSDENPNGCLIM